MHGRREGLAQYAPPVGGVSRGRARMKAGEACGALQGPPPAQVATLRATGGAKVPVVLTGTRGGKHRHTRAGQRAAPATDGIAPDVSIPRRARNRNVAWRTLTRVRDRGNEQMLLGLS